MADNDAFPPRLLVVWHLLDLARTDAGRPHGRLHGFATGATLRDDCGLGDSAYGRWLGCLVLLVRNVGNGWVAGGCWDEYS